MPYFFYFFILCFFQTSSLKSADFKANNWGDNRVSVIAKEGKEPLKNKNNYVIFSDIFDGSPVFITYLFNNKNQLKNVSYFFREKKANKNAYILTYNDLKKYFISQYGKAKKDKILWHNQKLKGQNKKLGEAISKGHLEYFSQWIIKNSSVELKLGQAEGEPRIALIYKEKNAKTLTAAIDYNKLKLEQKAIASKDEKINVMFFELKAMSGFDKERAKVLEEIVLAELYKYKKFNVISKGDVEKILNAEEFKQIECSDNSCLMEISGALGAEILLSGAIGKLGKISQLSLKMLNNQDGTVYSRVSRTIKGDEEVLVSETKASVMELIKGYDPNYNLILKIKAKKLPKNNLETQLSREVKGDAQDDEDGLLSSWWFWGGLGALIAGGLAFALADSDKEDSSKKNESLVIEGSIEVGN